eukprot:scaffold67009_cov42-Attheya_sp.AAC.4
MSVAQQAGRRPDVGGCSDTRQKTSGRIFLEYGNSKTTDRRMSHSWLKPKKSGGATTSQHGFMVSRRHCSLIDRRNDDGEAQEHKEQRAH